MPILRQREPSARPDPMCVVRVYASKHHGAGHVVAVLARTCGVSAEAACSLALRLDVCGAVDAFTGPQSDCEHVIGLVLSSGPDPSVNPAGPSLVADLFLAGPDRPAPLELPLVAILSVLLVLAICGLVYLESNPILVW